MNGEIEKHTKDNLDFLLCGAKPLISSRRLKSPPVVQDTEQKEVDLTGFPEPTLSIKRTRPKTAQSLKDPLPKSRTMDCPSYNKVKKELNEQKIINDCLTIHENNQKRKLEQIHQDWEEQFMLPFGSRMKKKLNGSDYNTFRRSQSRAYTSLSARPPSTSLYHEEPEKVPFVRVSTSGLDDRVHKASINAKKEQQLTRTITSLSARKPVPIEDLDDNFTTRPELSKISLLYETRFCDRADPNPAVGKKYFTRHNTSRISQVISNLSNN